MHRTCISNIEDLKWILLKIRQQHLHFLSLNDQMERLDILRSKTESLTISSFFFSVLAGLSKYGGRSHAYQHQPVCWGMDGLGCPQGNILKNSKNVSTSWLLMVAWTETCIKQQRVSPVQNQFYSKEKQGWGVFINIVKSHTIRSHCTSINAR